MLEYSNDLGKRYDTQVPLTDPFFKEMFQTRVNTYPYIHRLQASSALPEEDNCTMLEIQVYIYHVKMIFLMRHFKKCAH